MIVPPLLAFQNCGKGFVAAQINGASALCKAQMKSEALQMKWSAQDLRCDDFNSYACERRIFSPDVENMTHALQECLPGDSICVDVEVRQFATAQARSPSSRPEDFAPGGSYNHEEVRCYHRWLYEGMAIFEGDQGSLAESLSAAMSACENALENQ